MWQKSHQKGMEETLGGSGGVRLVLWAGEESTVHRRMAERSSEYAALLRGLRKRRKLDLN